MRTKLGKSIISDRELSFDFDILKQQGKSINIAMIGASGSGKTNLIKNIIRQWDDELNTSVILLTDHVEDYTNIHTDVKIDLTKDSDFGTICSDIHYKINRNSIQKIHTIVIIDYSPVEKLKDIELLLQDVSVIGRVHNCSLIYTSFSIKDITKKVINNSNILCYFKTFKSELCETEGLLDDMGLTKKVRQIITNDLKRGQYVINVDGHKAFIQSERNND